MEYIDRIRISIGTSIQLGLRKGKLPDPPTTAYLMVGDKCLNNCSFCTQARSSSSDSNMLSRVSWPKFALDDVIEALSKAKKRGFGRICLQCLNDPRMISELPDLAGMIQQASGLPISVSIGPMSEDRLRLLKGNGVERVGVALDGASKRIFDRIKGKCVGNPNTWTGTWDALKRSVSVFGRGNVSTHVIVGMGETDREIFDLMKRSNKLGVLVSLFAYTPMKGTAYEGDPPQLVRYRALQLMRFGIIECSNHGAFEFDENGKLTDINVDAIRDHPGFHDAFRTRGCPDCNRPYYNERPNGPMYNYPSKVITSANERGLEEAIEYLKG